MFAFLQSVRKPIGRISLVIAAAFALAACEPVSRGSSAIPDAGAGGAVPVALLVPAGSPDGGLILARSLENAARLAIADLDGVEIDLRVYDTAGQPGIAADVARRAVEDGARILIGPVFASAANAAGVAVASSGVNVLSFSNNTSIAGGNVFVLGNTFENTASRLVGYARGQGKSDIFVVHGRSTAEELGRDAIVTAIRSNGANLAGTASFELSQQSVAAAIPGIAADVKATDADAVFMTSGTDGALSFIVDGLAGAGLPPDVAQYIGLQRLDIPASALSLRGIQGSWFALPDPNLTSRFDSRYQAAYGTAPHPIAGLAYDGIAAIGALAASGRGSDLSAAALTQGSGFVGVNGIFRFRRDGTNQRGMAVAQIQNNRVVVIDPAPRNFGGAGS